MKLIKILPSALLLGAMSLVSLPLYADDQQGPVAPKMLNLSSLMFSPTDIANLQKVMEAKENYEGNAFDPLDGDGVDDNEILREIQRRAIKEQQDKNAQTALPDLYVASMVYRSPADWTVWVRKHLFQPLKAVNPDQVVDTGEQEVISSGAVLVVLTAGSPSGDTNRMQVSGISKDAVTLKYRPDAGNIAYKRFQNKEKETRRLKQFVNRISDNVIRYDEARNEFTVELKTNQTFSLNMMRVIEGRTLSGHAPNLLAAGSSTEAVAAPDEVPSANVADESDDGFEFVSGSSIEAKAANKLIGDLQKMQKFLPTNQMK